MLLFLLLLLLLCLSQTTIVNFRYKFSVRLGLSGRLSRSFSASFFLSLSFFHPNCAPTTTAASLSMLSLSKQRGRRPPTEATRQQHLRSEDCHSRSKGKCKNNNPQINSVAKSVTAAAAAAMRPATGTTTTMGAILLCYFVVVQPSFAIPQLCSRATLARSILHHGPQHISLTLGLLVW